MNAHPTHIQLCMCSSHLLRCGSCHRDASAESVSSFSTWALEFGTTVVTVGKERERGSEWTNRGLHWKESGNLRWNNLVWERQLRIKHGPPVCLECGSSMNSCSCCGCDVALEWRFMLWLLGSCRCLDLWARWKTNELLMTRFKFCATVPCTTRKANDYDGLASRQRRGPNSPIASTS